MLTRKSSRRPSALLPNVQLGGIFLTTGGGGGGFLELTGVREGEHLNKHGTFSETGFLIRREREEPINKNRH